MKKIPVLLLLMISAIAASSQNLVPNPSFEDTVACPSILNQMNLAIGWSSFRQSPDYFNACSTDSLAGVPQNAFGFQFPATGNGYSGFQAFFTPGYREILGCSLSSPMIIGATYNVSFKVVRAHGGILNARCGCNKLGLKFTTTFYTLASPIGIDNFAHVFTDSIISDTLNWTTISGLIEADSSYQYLSIGNFFDDFHTDTNSYSGTGCRAVYYLDDVSVILDSTLSITDKSHIENLLIMPNPVLDLLTIKIGKELSSPTQIEILNSVGSLILKIADFKLKNNPINIDVSDLNEGVYFLRIKLGNQVKFFKIIKI